MEDRANEELIQGLADSLKEVAGANSPVIIRDARLDRFRADFIVEVELWGRPLNLIVESKQLVYPRDVREAAWQLRNYIAHVAPERRQVVPLIMAETISPGARKLLGEEGVGYYDGSGSLSISTKGIFVLIEKPFAKRQIRSLNNLFVGSRARALHAIWLLRENWFGVHEIAARASVSATTASQMLIALERRDWVVSRGSGPAKERHLSNPRALLDAWAAYQVSTKTKPVRRYYVRALKTPDFLHRLDRVCEDHGVTYEITGDTAGQAYAPHLSNVSQVHCRLLAGSGIEAALESLEARPVREGWNLGLIEAGAKQDFVFRQRVGDVWVADPLQTYLDLLQMGGRSKELADHLRLEKLAP
jgi:hypothetical protein